MEDDSAPARQGQSRRRRHMDDDDVPAPQGQRYSPQIVPGQAQTPPIASRLPWTWGTVSSEAAASHLRCSKRARAAGTSEEAILGLLQEVTGGSREGEECAVCLQDFRAEETLREMPCSHRFHHHCISEWLRRKAVCPLCRHQLLPATPTTPEEDEEEGRVRVVSWEVDEDTGVVYGEVEEDGRRRAFGFFSAHP